MDRSRNKKEDRKHTVKLHSLKKEKGDTFRLWFALHSRSGVPLRLLATIHFAAETNERP